MEKIWYPDAGANPDVMAVGREDKLDDLQADVSEYTDDVKEQYRFLLDEGKFKDGKMPLVPPMHEWCVYDF